ncbi:uncharacterized protein LOC111249110 isoform X5 [Varroa destructor]|uniref:Uncharacterized protein n=1 Tax=Varroa destructor TaxID=109461 RepID=A0A7M7JWT5_VARDE|nr:uncharacterized protein LOC111249110 isoform X5 [Varroa destructor]
MPDGMTANFGHRVRPNIGSRWTCVYRQTWWFISWRARFWRRPRWKHWGWSRRICCYASFLWSRRIRIGRPWPWFPQITCLRPGQGQRGYSFCQEIRTVSLWTRMVKKKPLDI